MSEPTEFVIGQELTEAEEDALEREYWEWWNSLTDEERAQALEASKNVRLINYLEMFEENEEQS
jgi:hypothetical protein